MFACLQVRRTGAEAARGSRAKLRRPHDRCEQAREAWFACRTWFCLCWVGGGYCNVWRAAFVAASFACWGARIIVFTLAFSSSKRYAIRAMPCSYLRNVLSLLVRASCDVRSTTQVTNQIDCPVCRRSKGIFGKDPESSQTVIECYLRVRSRALQRIDIMYCKVSHTSIALPPVIQYEVRAVQRGLADVPCQQAAFELPNLGMMKVMPLPCLLPALCRVRTTMEV